MNCHKQVCRWEVIKKELVSRCMFVKMHVTVDAKGRKAIPCIVTRGRTHDSPMLIEMIKRVPGGTVCVMLAGYNARKITRSFAPPTENLLSALVRATSSKVGPMA